MQEGPSIIIRKYCTGCTNLKLEYWKDYLENDETDSGTDATCLKENIHMGMYYSSSDQTPSWCPYNEPE